MDITTLRSNLCDQQQLVADLAERNRTVAMDNTSTLEQITSARTELQTATQRAEALQQSLDIAMAQAPTPPAPGVPGAPMDKRTARGMFFQAVLDGRDPSTLPRAAYEQLGAIPAEDEDLGHGSRLLPTQLAADILMEPVDANPLRPYMEVTSVQGLVVPKMAFTLADDDFKTDKQLASELKADVPELISFGQFVSSISASISESVLRGSPYNVEATVIKAIQDQQGLKELRKITATSPATGEEHMSLYSTKNAIAKVQGETMFDALLLAIAGLHDIFRANAAIAMPYLQYVQMLRDLANNNMNFYGAQPEEVVGKPIVFSDFFTQPVVGDFKKLHLNFNGAPWYDTDKDVKKRLRVFVQNADYDIQVMLSSAFRIAEVSEVTGG